MRGDAVKYVKQMIMALNYCHSRGIKHLELKLENFLITGDGTLKMADFGQAVHRNKSRRLRECGTLVYMAPETISKKRTFCENSNAWTLGAIAQELLTGKLAFNEDDEDDETVKYRIRNVIYHKSSVKSK